MTQLTLETLFAQFQSAGDLDALAEVFDRVAPELERLARKLTVDRNQADDLVQATFLIALERPSTFDVGRALRPWLLGILVHRASEERRRKSRQAELALPMRPDVEPPLAALDALEFREAVTRAVAELPPSLRVVVEGKLLQDREAKELARELEISRGALRVRLHRGLEKIRATLPPSLATLFATIFIHSNGLAQVRSRVLNEAASVSAKKGLAVSTGAVGTMALSKQSGLIGGVLAIAMLVGAFFLLNSPDAAQEASAAPRGTELAEANESVAPIESSNQSRTAIVVDELVGPQAAFGTVAVQVAYADGSPAAEFEVQLSLRTGFEAEVLVRATDDKGRAEFEVSAIEQRLQVIVPATETTTRAMTWTRQDLAAGETIDVELTVSNGWPLSGTVLDAEGRPVPEAEVSGWCGGRTSEDPDRLVRADREGRFRIEHLGPKFVVLARAPGLVCSRGLRGELSDSVEATGLTIELAAERRMHGVVLDPARVPVEGAEISISHGLGSYSGRDQTHVFGVLHFRAGSGKAVSDDEGRFSISGLPHKSHSVSVKKRPFLQFRDSLPTGEDPVEIVFDAGLSLAGRVFDSKGRPAAGAKVRFWPYFGNVQTTKSRFVCDDDGRFELRGILPPDEWSEHNYVIAAQYEGHSLLVIEGVKPTREGGDYVEMRLDPESVIAGRVLDTSGQPVAGVTVWVEGDREMDINTTFERRCTWEYCNHIDEVKTDEEGRFRLNELYDGEFIVHAISPEDRNQTVDFETRSGNEEIELVLDPQLMRKVVLVGTVRDAFTDEPITSFNVMPFIEGSSHNNRFTSDEGAFELPGLPAGRIRVVVEAEGYARQRLNEREYSLGEHQLDIRLVPRRSLELSILDVAGEPYAGGDVEVFDLSGKQLMIGAPSSGTSSRATIAKGRALLHGLPAEQLTLRIRVGVRDQAGVHEVPVDLTTPMDGPLELTLESAPKLERPIPLGFLVLVAASGGSFEEVDRELRRCFREGDKEWFEKAMQDGMLSFPTSKVEATVEYRGRVLTQGSLTPKAEGVFLVEQSEESRSWGGISMGSSSSSERPEPVLELGRVPAETVVVKLNAEGCFDVELAVDCSSANGGEIQKYILLQRK